jgi:hypothetical protein
LCDTCFAEPGLHDAGHSFTNEDGEEVGFYGADGTWMIYDCVYDEAGDLVSATDTTGTRLEALKHPDKTRRYKDVLLLAVPNDHIGTETEYFKSNDDQPLDSLMALVGVFQSGRRLKNIEFNNDGSLARYSLGEVRVVKYEEEEEEEKPPVVQPASALTVAALAGLPHTHTHTHIRTHTHTYARTHTHTHTHIYIRTHTTQTHTHTHTHTRTHTHKHTCTHEHKYT